MKDVFPISVVMLTYNRQDMVGRMIECVLRQSFRDFEFIIVDNGSTDRSGAIAAEYAVRDDRVRVLRQKRGNIGSGRNAGLAAARGRYLAFVDDDDTCEPDYLRFLYDLAEENKADVAICGATDKIFAEKVVMNAQTAVTELLWRKKYNVAFPAKLFRRALFTEQRFPERGRFDDIALMPRILAGATLVAYHGLPKYTFYRHGGNNSSWTTDHRLITPEVLTEYLAVYRQRTDWLDQRFPAATADWRYFEWSFMISMLEKISRLGLSGCEQLADDMRRELCNHYDDFYHNRLTLDFEKVWLTQYVERHDEK